MTHATIRRLTAASGVALTACATPPADPPTFGVEDEQALEALHADYTEAWLAGDSAAVLEALTDDVVLLPHWGDDPLEGSQAAARFWWPDDGPAVWVTQFVHEPEEIGGEGDLGFARGRYAIEFEVKVSGSPQRITTAGNYLMLFRRTTAGWKISHRIWNDPPPP